MSIETSKYEIVNEFWNACADETLPPDYIKLPSAGRATVFRLDLENETAVHVAEWPEQ